MGVLICTSSSNSNRYFSKWGVPALFYNLTWHFTTSGGFWRLVISQFEAFCKFIAFAAYGDILYQLLLR